MDSREAGMLLAAIFIAQALFLPVIQAPDAAAAAPSPVKWHKYARNPVLGLGPGGSWDDDWILLSSVLRAGNEYRMYYGACDGTERAIGLATSPDGLNWTKYPGNPIMRGDGAGTWCTNRVLAPRVILEGGVYKMWFVGSDWTHARLGFASSTDGINFSKYGGNPVLDAGPEGDWDHDVLDFPMVLHENNMYRLWYVGQQSSNQRIGYATSPDGLSWTRYAQNPVFDFGEAGEWDETKATTPFILNLSGTLRMWYGGHSGTNYAIGHATSDDGVRWRRYAHNPLMTGQSDGFGPGHNLCPVVMLDGTAFRMWYTVGNASWGDTGVGYAEGYNRIPDPPALQAPPNGSLADGNTPSLSWGFSDPDQYDAQAAFQVQLDDSPDFGSVDHDSGTVRSNSMTYAPVAPLPDGIYHWRVRVWDSDGDNGAWSDPWSIEIRELSRPVVTILKPAQNATLTGRSTFAGTSGHPEAGQSVRLVQARIDGGGWLDARGTANWSFPFNTVGLGNGKHTVTVRAFDGTIYSREESREFKVKNETGWHLNAQCLTVIAIILMLAIAATATLAALQRRRDLAERAAPPPESRRP